MKKGQKPTYNFTPNALFRGGPVTEYNACVGETVDLTI